MRKCTRVVGQWAGQPLLCGRRGQVITTRTRREQTDLCETHYWAAMEEAVRDER